MMEFSLETYKEIILDLQSRGFSFLHPGSWDLESVDLGLEFGDLPDKAVLLRHDVDMGLHASLEMAELEESLGVRSYYFFQLTSPFYSLLSPDSLQIFDMIRMQGHGVGLHLDPSTDLAVHTELDIFSSLAETVEYLPASLHNPSVTDSDAFVQALDDLDGKVASVLPIRMNGPEIMDHFYYWSDSLMIPRRPLSEVVEEQNHLQLLFHPEQWVNGVEDYRQAFDMAHIKNVMATEQAKSAFYDGCEVSLKSRSEVDPVLLKEMRSGS